MKNKIIVSILAILAVCGCQLKELNEVISESKSFTATVEDIFNGGNTRTSLDDQGNVLFKQGDQISIFIGSTINEQFQVTDDSDGKTSASLIQVSGSGFVAGGELESNVAYYPYASATTIARNGDAYVLHDITIPSVQHYAEGSFGNGAFPMAAVTNDTDDMHLKFKNVLGGLKLQLTGTASISSISFTGNNNEILCGAAEVTVSNTSTPTISLTDVSAKTVTLDCGDGVQLNSETATSFIIALPPMTMTGGFTVVVTDTEGKQMEIKTTNPQTINRSKLLKMPAVAYEGTPAARGPLTFTSTGATSISLTKTGSPEAITLEYKLDDRGWINYSVGDVIDLTDGQMLSFRAGASGNSSFSQSLNDYYKFTLTGSGTIAASGSIMSLVSQEETSVIPSAYYFRGLFQDCTSLTSAPELPATTLADYCYNGMFDGCTSLTSAPELPATTLFRNCYCNMFQGCTILTTAPELPATTLANLCYLGMFRNCYSLTTAPELPATSLANHCYDQMFRNCYSLTTAPELPATTLADGCYSQMFYCCMNLNFINCLATDITANHCLYSWVYGVSPSGVFIKNPNTTWPAGAGGIPEGWTVYPTGLPAEAEAVDLGLSVKWANINVGATSPEEYGGYFAWGETEPKADYSWKTHKWCNGSLTTLTKYNTKSANGTIDNKTTLDLEDDAARANWGGNWRMPTDAEWTELRNNCTWTWVTNYNGSGINGILVKSKTNSNSIFLPAAGYRYNANLSNVGFYGYYWSSSLYAGGPYYAFRVFFRSDDVRRSVFNRYCGHSVRPVCPKD